MCLGGPPERSETTAYHSGLSFTAVRFVNWLLGILHNMQDMNLQKLPTEDEVRGNAFVGDQ